MWQTSVWLTSVGTILAPVEAAGWAELTQVQVKLFSPVIHALWTDLVIDDEEAEADRALADS